jgi:hypothetical protein
MARNPVQVLSRYNEIFGDTFWIYLAVSRRRSLPSIPLSFSTC